jgi:hypothetical protein
MKNTLYPPSAGLALAVATPLLALLASLSPGRTVHAQTPTSNTKNNFRKIMFNDALKRIST